MGKFERHLPAALIAVLFLTPLIPGDSANHVGGLRVLMMWGAAAALFALAITQRIKPLLEWWDVAAIGLVVWAVISFLLYAPDSGLRHGIALAEVLRLGDCVVLYLGVRNVVIRRRQLREVWTVILAGSVLVAVAGIASAHPSQDIPAAAAYGNKQLLAAFLVGFLPFSFASALCAPGAIRRRLAWVGVIAITAALLLTGNRTSWIAGLVGLGVAAVLVRKHAATARPTFARAAIAIVISVGCIVAIIEFTGAGEMLRSRTVSWRAQITASSRLQLWHAAMEMTHQRPITGWGVGSFAWKAWDYGNGAVEFMPPEQLAKQGPSLSTTAHNEYLQMAAEMGIVGVGFYLAVLVEFFFRCGRVLSRGVGGQRRCFVAAALAAAIAQSLDAFANPGWHYGEVAPMLWLMLGLGLAARRKSPATV